MGKSEKRRGDSWVIMEVCEDCDSLSTESQSNSLEDSTNSIGSSISSSSSDLVEDACSPTSSVSNGALYDLSDLMVNLPIKKGLSRYFEGKSQSFTSLVSVKSIEDLAKRVDSPHRKKMKASKSYGWGLDGQKLHSPKATISKKAAGKGYLISSLGSKKGPSIRFCRPPTPLQRN